MKINFTDDNSLLTDKVKYKIVVLNLHTKKVVYSLTKHCLCRIENILLLVTVLPFEIIKLKMK